jgi:hypothetical protein
LIFILFKRKTVFELKKNSDKSDMMKERRDFFSRRRINTVSKETIQNDQEGEEGEEEMTEAPEEVPVETPEEPESLAEKLLNPNKKRKRFLIENKSNKKSKMEKTFKDENFYITSERPIQEQIDDHHYSLGNNLDNAVLDLGGDERNTLKKASQVLIWDKKKKKYVRKHLSDGQHVKNNKIINESGAMVSKDHKPELYKKWKLNTKKRIQTVGETEDQIQKQSYKPTRSMDDDGDDSGVKSKSDPKKKKGGKSAKNELRTEEQIQKIRRDKEKKMKKQQTKEKINQLGWKKMAEKFHADGMMRAHKKRENQIKERMFNPKPKGRKKK